MELDRYDIFDDYDFCHSELESNDSYDCEHLGTDLKGRTRFTGSKRELNILDSDEDFTEYIYDPANDPDYHHDFKMIIPYDENSLGRLLKF